MKKVIFVSILLPPTLQIPRWVFTHNSDPHCTGLTINIYEAKGRWFASRYVYSCLSGPHWLLKVEKDAADLSAGFPLCTVLQGSFLDAYCPLPYSISESPSPTAWKIQRKINPLAVAGSNRENPWGLLKAKRILDDRRTCRSCTYTVER